MGGVRGSLGRWLPALILTGLFVAVFVTDFVPALRERNDLRRARAAAEGEVDTLRDDVRRDEAWMRAAQQGDTYVIEREADRLRRTPDLPGPTYVIEAPPADEPDEGSTASGLADGEVLPEGTGPGER